MPTECLVEPAHVCRVDLVTRVITIRDDLPPFDAAFAYAHEIGHLFDNEMLTDELRARFATCVDLPAVGWLFPASKYNVDPGEAFATAYAMLSISAPRWNSYHMTRYWQPARDDVTLRTTYEVIQEACRTPEPAART
jgi:hypothetical protein